jgi:cytochrome c-type biogenesis protein CcmH/NrfG
LDKLSVLVQESASLKIQNSKYEEASKAYETLVQIDPGNKSHLAGLVQALSFVDIEKAEQYVFGVFKN